MTAAATAESDGRRRRTLESRERIIEAMVALTQAGHVSVSAELVAERARVGLRTVFRHFKDMDSLYREMSRIMEARIAEAVARPFSAPDWQGRLIELIARRARVFETITPFKRAEAAHRHRSRFLEADTARMNRRLREILAGVVPAELREDAARFEALDLLLSFESWDRLRREQGLSAARAKAVLETAVRGLVG